MVHFWLLVGSGDVGEAAKAGPRLVAHEQERQ